MLDLPEAFGPASTFRPPVGTLISLRHCSHQSKALDHRHAFSSKVSISENWVETAEKLPVLELMGTAQKFLKWTYL